MTQPITQSFPFLALPCELQCKIVSYTNSYPSLAEVSHALRELVNDTALSILKNMFPAIQENMNYLHSLSDKPHLFSIFFSDLAKEILSMEEGKEFLEELQNKNKPFFSLERIQQFFWPTSKVLRLQISFENAKQMLEWKRDKNLIVLCEHLNIPELNLLLKNIINANLSKKAKDVRAWLLNEENQNAILQIQSLKKFGFIDPKKQLTALPSEIEQFIHLQILVLGGNKLTSLPKEIGQLTSLQLLDLSSNKLLALPKEIAQLTHLKLLTLDENMLTSLPKEIAHLTALEILDLSFNNLTLSSQIGQLTSLKLLALDGNQCTSLPQEIKQSTSLEILNLSSNNFVLPSLIKQFNFSGPLYSWQNQLTSLPKETKESVGMQMSYLVLRARKEMFDQLLTTKPEEILKHLVSIL